MSEGEKPKPASIEEFKKVFPGAQYEKLKRSLRLEDYHSVLNEQKFEENKTNRTFLLDDLKKEGFFGGTGKYIRPELFQHPLSF